MPGPVRLYQSHMLPPVLEIAKDVRMQPADGTVERADLAAVAEPLDALDKQPADMVGLAVGGARHLARVHPLFGLLLLEAKDTREVVGDREDVLVQAVR